MKTKSYGFTIVELLVVIVVIGILAAITIISYTGISKKAEISSLQSDLANSSKQLNLFQVEKSTYPATISTNCSTNPTDATNLCIKNSGTNTYGYKYYSPNSYMLVSMIGNTCYSITNNSSPVENCVTIGTQTWMRYNLDVGDRVDATVTQTNNSVVEKWCYNDDSNNCALYGGYYQWDEMMQYSTAPGVQGIAPTGFHIPTDEEYKTLEIALGMSQVPGDYNGGVDGLGGRGTTQGDQLGSTGFCSGRTPCGTSGFNGLLGGAYYQGTGWATVGALGNFYLSTQYNASNVWFRGLHIGTGQVFRAYDIPKTQGFSVRAIKD